MVRKIRLDAMVGTVEKTRGLPAGTIRNTDGSDARSDKKIDTIRKKLTRRKNSFIKEMFHLVLKACSMSKKLLYYKEGVYGYHTYCREFNKNK